MADKYAEEANLRGIEMCHVAGLLLQALRVAIPTVAIGAICAYFHIMGLNKDIAIEEAAKTGGGSAINGILRFDYADSKARNELTVPISSATLSGVKVGLIGRLSFTNTITQWTSTSSQLCKCTAVEIGQRLSLL